MGLKGTMGGRVPQVSKQYARWTLGPGRTGGHEGRGRRTWVNRRSDTSKHWRDPSEGVKPSNYFFSIFTLTPPGPPSVKTMIQTQHWIYWWGRFLWLDFQVDLFHQNFFLYWFFLCLRVPTILYKKQLGIRMLIVSFSS